MATTRPAPQPVGPGAQGPRARSCTAGGGRGSARPTPRPSSPAPHAGQAEAPSRKASPRTGGGLFGVSAAQPTVSQPRPRAPPPSSRVSVLTSLLRAPDTKTNLGGLRGGPEAEAPGRGCGGRPLCACQSTYSGRRRALLEGRFYLRLEIAGDESLWTGIVLRNKTTEGKGEKMSRF